MKRKLDFIVSVTLLACAVSTTGVVLRRAFGTLPGPNTQTESKATYINNWRPLLSTGVRMGRDVAPVQILEFADFECPFCRSFHKTLKNLEAKYPNQIALTYVHFPIQGHRFAIPAARAAECASDQGKFEAMSEALFEGQDQYGLKPWYDYATVAGVPDLPTFDACIKRTSPIPRVEAGKALGAKLEVQGTPTIIINGLKLARPPTGEELDQMVQRILTGRRPVDATF